jgi:hypothetical protein
MPPAWIDVAADLEVALEAVRLASDKAASLPGLSADLRQDREIAIGKLLHDGYSAAEKAVERLIEMVDGSVPGGSSFHRDLLRRAAHGAEGRPAILTPETATALQELLGFRHVFRHVYGGFDYAKAAPLVTLAAATIPRLRDELQAFAATLGLAPRA